jgi:AcrR family transcriptional regulator
MPKRRDGLATRAQLLKEAVDVFAAHGYHKASVAEICRRAGANGAAINYHFGDKESLYVAVWRDLAGRMFKFSETIALTGSARTRLEMSIGALILQMSDEGQFGSLHRLHLHEMINPTGLIDGVVREYREPFRQKLLGIIRELVGPGLPDEAVSQCEISVISQCRSVMLLRQHPDMIGRRTFTSEDVKRMVAHVVAFSLGGIARIGKQDSDAVQLEGRGRKGYCR